MTIFEELAAEIQRVREIAANAKSRDDAARFVASINVASICYRDSNLETVQACLQDLKNY